jgi:polyribonucleotide nucleotidyltransferase
MSKLGVIDVAGTIGDAEIRFETGKLARLAGGAVVASIGETILLVTSTASSRPKEHLDFFPLTVDYEERMYAAGKIPGGFFKREGRPSEQAILTCRLVDRPMRPTFAGGLRNEVQILITTLSADQTNPPDVLAINGASIATLLAGIPFDGPIAGVRLAMGRDGSWTPFPTFEFLEHEAVFDLVVAGRLNQEHDEIDILMVEAEATASTVDAIAAGAPAPTEDVVAGAIEESKTYLRQLCDLQMSLVKQTDREEGNFQLYPAYDDKVYAAVEKSVSDALRAVLSDGALDKSTRNERIANLREQALDAVFADAGELDISDEELEKQGRNAFRSLEKQVIRQRIVRDGVRIDGRGVRDIRPLSADVGVLPRAHGSGMFTRGETQVLNILTLGMLREAQRLDNLSPEEEKRYIHHYNFPPFSTGETGFMRGPKRREIGHGALAERALRPVIPDADSFAYALRLVSEVLSSNGSTSMASVCASTLSLMDAGVPVAAPVAGIAMGLIAEDGSFVTLTDIQGAEDAFGDMDFKVAGTADFITALQLDTKLSGIPARVLADALEQALEARHTILDVITDTIPEPRAEMNPHAPRVIVEYIPGDKIGEVIGPKGKIIREITEETGADVDIDDVDGRGVVKIYAADAVKAQAALERIRAIANPVIPQEGERYFGTVVKTTDFGAFVSLTPGSDGLLHISKLGGDRRLAHADEAVSVGDKLWVEVIQVRDGRKFSLALVDGPGSGDADGGSPPPALEADESAAAYEPVRTEPEPEPRERTRERARGSEAGLERERTRGGRGDDDRVRGGQGDDDRTVSRRRRRRRQP